LRTRSLITKLLVALATFTLPLAAQQDQPPSLADTLPPPLPLDASGKPVAAPKSNLERADFARAIYVDAVGNTLKSDASIRKLVQDCREVGFDTIVAQVRAYGDAYYQSDVVPHAADLKADLDPLKVLIEEAHNGAPRIRVVAMVSALRVAMKGQELPPRHVLLDHRDWLTKSVDGSEEVGDSKNEYWLDPAVVGVQDHIALVAAEIARKYAVDGIEMERVRMPDVSLKCGYNPQALERFKAEKGGSDKPDPKDPAWVEWRRNQVTELLRKTREAVKAARADIQFGASAITYGAPPLKPDEFLKKSTPGAYALCDWQGWAQQGIVDAISLMDYKAAETRAGEFEGWMNFALANKGKAKVTVVVGGWMNTARLTSALMLLPIFDPRADGVALYSYHSPSAAPESPETAFSIIKAVLRKENVERQAPRLVESLSKPLTIDQSAALARLNQIASVITGAASATAAAASTPPPLTSTPRPDLPSLSGIAASTPQPSELPPLSGAQTAPVAQQMPVLGAGTTQQAAQPSGEKTMPPLQTANQAAATQPSMPSLSEATAAQPPAPASAPTLPALGQAVQPAAGAPAQQEPSAAMPSLSQEAAGPTPALPQLGAPTLPQAGQQQAAAPASELPVAAPPAAAAPALPELNPPTSLAAPQQAQPAPLPAAAQEAGPVAGTPVPANLADKFSRMGIPTEETHGAVSIPGNTGETNFGPTAVTTPAPAPTFVAPSVLSPTPAAQRSSQPVDVLNLMSTPAAVDRSNTHESPFVKATPQGGLYRYTPQPSATPAPPPGLTPSEAELIILKNGQQFVGRVLDRGATWRIQLPNGSRIAIPGSKVAGTRPVTTTGASPSGM
jgi:uncharacterized lipoprotein YddW (UPF0748 family)